MKKTKLIKLLATFQPTELRRFKDFVASPYFNKNKKLQSLLAFILKFAPHFEGDDFNEEKAFNFVFKGKTFKNQVITKLSSKLYKLAFKFIGLDKGNEKAISNELSFSNFLIERGLIQECLQYIQQVQKDLEKITIHDSHYFYNCFLLEQDISKFNLVNKSFGIKGRNLKPPSVALDKFYLLLKLMYSVFQINEQHKSKKEQFNFELVDQLEAYVPNSPYFEEVNIKIWYTILLLAKSEDKKLYYIELKKLIFDHHKELNKRDLKNCLSNLQNNARLVFENKEAYYQELFQLYNFQLEEGIFKNPLIFNQHIFINIITVALLLNKLTWIENFLQDAKEYDLLAEDDVLVLGNAMLAISKKEFSDALDFLNASKYKDFYFKMRERRMRLKVYFELEFFDLFDDSINSFRKFLSKNKDRFEAFHFHSNRDFVNFMNQMFTSSVADQQKILKLEQEIKLKQALPEKKWLLEKISSMIKQRT